MCDGYIQVHGKLHLKTEALYNDYRSRAIMHHPDNVRMLIAGIYHVCSTQLYQSPHMIKLKTS